MKSQALPLHYDALCTSIAEIGVLTPLVIFVDAEGKRWLLDGRSRVKAMAELGLTDFAMEFDRCVLRLPNGREFAVEFEQYDDDPDAIVAARAPAPDFRSKACLCRPARGGAPGMVGPPHRWHRQGECPDCGSRSGGSCGANCKRFTVGRSTRTARQTGRCRRQSSPHARAAYGGDKVAPYVRSDVASDIGIAPLTSAPGRDAADIQAGRLADARGRPHAGGSGSQASRTGNPSGAAAEQPCSRAAQRRHA